MSTMITRQELKEIRSILKQSQAEMMMYFELSESVSSRRKPLPTVEAVFGYNNQAIEKVERVIMMQKLRTVYELLEQAEATLYEGQEDDGFDLVMRARELLAEALDDVTEGEC